MIPTFEWRGDIDNAALCALMAAAFGGRPSLKDWRSQLCSHSLGWVCATHPSAGLVGFVNVPWDGDVHAFLLDTALLPSWQRHGIATDLVAVAVDHARRAGCQWLHVDYEPHLDGFYERACGFRPTEAGLIDLTAGAESVTIL